MDQQRSTDCTSCRPLWSGDCQVLFRYRRNYSRKGKKASKNGIACQAYYLSFTPFVKSINPVCQSGDRILHVGVVKVEFPEVVHDGHE